MTFTASPSLPRSNLWRLMAWRSLAPALRAAVVVVLTVGSAACSGSPSAAKKPSVTGDAGANLTPSDAGPLAPECATGDTKPCPCEDGGVGVQSCTDGVFAGSC